MSLILPDYVVESILKYVNTYFGTVNSKFIIESASKNGDSYSGDVYRIIIKVDDLRYGNNINTKSSLNFNNNNSYNNNNNKNNNNNDRESEHYQTGIRKEVCLITKTPPTNKLRRQIYNSSRHFAREHYAYIRIFPAFEKFQKNYLKEYTIFRHYPQMIAGSSEEGNEFVVLTDMKVYGFLNSDRPTPLSYRKCVAVLKALAEFHAISFSFKDQHPKEFSKLTESLNEIIFKEPVNKAMDNFLKKKVDYALTTLSDTGDEVVKRKLLEFRNCFSESMVNCISCKEEAVILHGDCWISNILFRETVHDDIEISFIDWQVLRYASPVIDLSYFIFCCTDSDLRQSLPTLLRIYQSHLAERIQSLGSNASMFSFEKLEYHMKKFARFGLGMALMTLHTTSCHSNDMPNVIETLDTVDLAEIDEISFKLISKPAYRKRMAGVCRDIVNFGYL